MNYFSRDMQGARYERLSSEEIERQVAEIDGYRTFMRSTTSHYDPIFTPLFTGLLGSFGAVTIVGNLTVAGLASAIATTALSIGSQYLLAPKPPKPEDGKQPLTQAIPYRHWVVGRRRVAGAYMLWEAKGAKLYAVQAIAGHEINAITKRWLHDDVVTVDGSGNVQALADGRYAANCIQLDHRLGLPTETAYAPIVADLAADDVWTDNHRGDGQASLSLVAKTPIAKDFTKRFPYGAPRFSVEVEGANVWDPRDVAQSPTDPSTWVYSRNAALIMLWHQCFSEFGHRRDYTRAILPVLDMWKAEADVCDEDVPLNGGGTEKRYLCDGFSTAEHDPKVGTNAILAACDGWICERGDGALLFVVGKFREEYCTTISDRDITGYQLQHDVLFKDECNRLIPKFTYPATDYTTSDTDYFEDTAAQLVAGRVLAQEADYGWCTQWRQARRLAIRDWRRLREKMKGTLDVRLSGINAAYNRWVRLSTPLGLPTLHGAIIENRRSVLALTKGGFTLDFIKHPANIDDWNPATDEGLRPPIPPKPTIANIPTPVLTGVIAKAKSNTVYLVVSIEDPDHDDLSFAIRYRIKDAGAGSPGAWVEQVFNDQVWVLDGVLPIPIPGTPVNGEPFTYATDPVPPDELLEVEAAFITARGKYGNWSSAFEVFSTADPVAPGVVTAVSATGGAGQATYNWTAPNSANYAGAVLYWNTTNTFGSATPVSPPKFGAPGAADSRIVTGITAGTRYGWVVAINRSGVAASPVATGSFTVT